MSEKVLVAAAAPFEAARRVEILPSDHRSRRLHGHGFIARLRATVPEEWADYPGSEITSLRRRLALCVRQLDYQYLNDILTIPTDENLARWIKARMVEIPHLALVGIQSTADEGVDLDGSDRAHIWHKFRFEAAHRLPNVPEGHPCGRMHGHGFEVILHAEQPLDDADMGIDFDTLGHYWQPLHEELHLSCLNELDGLENPTSELLAKWIWERLKSEVPALSWVTVYETVTAGCHYDGQTYRIWKEQRFESALRLSQAPEDDARRQLHGHSYLMRLHLSAPLDDVLGWTVDYGDVKTLFGPIYDQIDHQRLDELDGLAHADTVSLARWLKARGSEVLPQLDRLDIYETPSCGVILSWGGEPPALPA